MKTCTKCSIEKPFEAFHKHIRKKDGLHNSCKECNKAYGKTYYQDNKEKMSEYTAQWRKDNPEKRKQQAKQERQRHKALRCALQVKRQASKLSATPAWLTPEDFSEIQHHYNLANYFTWLSGGFVKHHVDHIVPLQGKEVCGLHVPWNLRVLLAEDNLKKGNKLHAEQ